MIAEPATKTGAVAIDTGCVACQKVPLTAKVPVPAFAVTVPLTGCVACQKVPLTGCVTPEPSTRRRVLVTVKLEGIFVLSALRVVSVAAPVGSGTLAIDTGCVACQKVPLTG